MAEPPNIISRFSQDVSGFSHFESLYYHQEWPIGKIVKAECCCYGVYRHDTVDLKSCGIYSISDLEKKDLRYYLDGHIYAIGLVKLYGRITVGQYGYISESASLEKIALIASHLYNPIFPPKYIGSDIGKEEAKFIDTWLRERGIPFTSLRNALQLVNKSNHYIQQQEALDGRSLGIQVI